MTLQIRHAVTWALAVLAGAMAVTPAGAQTTNWTNTAGGSYFTTGNWDNGVPTTGYTANIAAAGTYTVTFGTGANSTINSLTLNDANATFSHTSGTLTLSALNLMAGSYALSGGTISGATITSTGGTIVVGSTTSILNDASIGAGSLNLTSSTSSLTIQGGTTFAAGSAYTLGGALTVNQSTEIDNLTLTLAASSILHSPTNGITMTLGPSTTVTTAATANITGVAGNSLANAGLLQETGNTFSLVIGGFGTITNTGTGAQGIVASGGGTVLINPIGAFNNSGRVEAMANSTVTILATNWTNTGTFAVDSGATLNLEGTFTTAAIGTITRTGANTIAIVGSLNNASATLALTAATGNYLLSGGTITGGSITTDGVGTLVIGSTTGTLSGVSVGVGALNMASTSSSLTTQGGTTFAAGSAYTLGGALAVNQSTEVDNLTLTLSSGALFHSTVGGVTMTLGASTTVTTAATANITGVAGNSLANAGLLQETGNTFSLVIGGFGTITNTGTGAQGIVASGGGTVLINPIGAFNNSGRVEAMANSTVTILATNWTNTGTFAVDSGATLNLEGTFTTAAIGTITRTGANTIAIVGSLNNASATLALTAATGNYLLSGGTITGGSITTDGVGTLVIGSTTGTLSGVSVGVGALNMASTSSSLTIQGGTNFAAGSAYTLGGTLSVSQSTEIDNLTLTLASGALLRSSTGSITVTLGASTTVTTAAAANIAGVAGNSLANAGLIQETGNTFSLVIGGFGTITNTGTGAQGIVASGGGAVLINPLGAFNNSGRVEAMANSTVTILATNWTNTGTFAVDSGATLNLEGTFTTAAIGTITRTGANTVAIAGSVNNASATLALTAATGNYLLSGATITGGSITSDGVGTLVVGSTSNTLSGVLVGAGALNMTSTSSSLTIQGGTNFAAGSAFTLGGTISVDQSTEIDNLTLTLASGALFHSPFNVTVTLGPSTTLTTAVAANITGIGSNTLANAGLIQQTGNFSLPISFGTISNTGSGALGIVASGGGSVTIDASVSFTNSGRVEAMANSTITIEGGNWTNTGTYKVDNGATLILGGTFTTTGMGTITRTGTNTINITGVLNNAASTLALTAATGTYVLNGGEITGGTITSDGVGKISLGPTTNSTLNGVLIGAGSLDLTSTNSVIIEGGTNFAPGSAYTLNGAINIDQSTSIDNLTLTLGSGSNPRTGFAVTVTLGATTTFTTTASASFTGSGSAGLANAGLIQETGTGDLSVSFGTFTNTGTLLVSGGGTLAISGVNTFTNISGTTLTGGTYHVIGPTSGTSTLTFNSHDVQTLGTGTTVILEGANSVFDVNNGTAIDNRLTTLAAGSQLQILNGRNYTVANPSSAFTNNGMLMIGSTAGPSTFTIGNGIDFSANYNAGTQTLSGGAYAVQGNATLALGSRQITTLAAGTTVTLTAAGTAQASFPALNSMSTNNGTFQMLGGQNFTTAGALTNTGTIQLGGGTLTVNGNLTNTGTLTGFGTIASNLQVNGGTFDPTGPITFAGNVDFNASTAVNAGGGSVSVTGTSTVHSGATVKVAAGVTYGGAGSVTVNSGGTLTVQGTVTQLTTVAGVLMGNATLTNSVIVQPGGFLRPGNSPGTIVIGGGLDLNGDYDWDINGNDNTMAGGTFDQVNGNGTVTLSTSGHINIKIGSGVNFGLLPFWAQTETWPILTAAGGFTDNSIPQLTVTPTAFLAVYPQAAFSLAEQPNVLNVIWSPGSVRQSGWIGGADGTFSNPANWALGAYPNGGAGAQLVFGPATSGTLTNDLPGTLMLNSLTFTAGSPVYNLSGNGLNLVTNNGTLPQIVSNSSNSVTIGTPMTLTNNLMVSGTGNVTLGGTISGPGSLTMCGSGTLMLGNGVNTYSGGTNVLTGTVQVVVDAVLGTGNVTGAANGTLSFIGSTATTKSFAMNGGTLAVVAFQTVTLNGSQVIGATLDGSGTFATNGVIFANVTTTPSVSMLSNSASDQFVHVSNGAALTFAGGLNPSISTAISNLNGFTNQGAGSVTIGAGSAINAANFQTYGTLSLAPNTISSPTVFTNTGSAPLGFNGGSRTFIGTPATADPSGQNIVAYLDLHGHNAIVSGGLFVNNGGVYDTLGAGTGTVIADYGSLVKGAGFFQNTVKTQNGGKFQTGNSPGSATFGNFVFGPGGVNNYVFAIDDATGTAGPSPNPAGLVSGWGLIKAVQVSLGAATTSGNFTWTATPSNPLTVAIDTLVNPTMVGTDVAGPMAEFDPNQPYSWTAARWTGTYSGPRDAATMDADTSFDTSGVVNPIAGTFGWSLDSGDQTLSLVYTPSAVPEPGTLTLVGLAVAGWACRRRRDRLAFN